MDLGEKSYEVLIGHGAIDRLGGYLRKISIQGRIAVMTHPKINRLYGERVRKSLRVAGYDPLTIEMPAGERYKTPRQIGKIYDRLIANRFERSDTLLALGGGVVGDMGGFAAATYLRGIAYIQCPSTVVAQVDASIGGKTGVDHPKGKNLIGAFHHPKLVCSDPMVLKTLAKREYLAGLAEVIKYGVISDADFFSYLESNTAAILAQDPDALLHCIHRSSVIKAEIVEKDERESGLRKILNYGHTFGHAIETLTAYRRFRHGEAVAIGMACASRLAHRLGFLKKQDVDRQIDLFEAFGLPSELPSFQSEDILNVMARDKKVVGGEIYFVLPEKIGAVRVAAVDRKTLKALLTAL
ncbi:MAG: 3-dehydroquinate synthase [Nitrospiria bacterium]